MANVYKYHDNNHDAKRCWSMCVWVNNELLSFIIMIHYCITQEENSTYAFFINDRENELTTCLSKTMESLDTKGNNIYTLVYYFIII